MELKDLKKTWANLYSDKELNEYQISDMLRNKAGNLIERIDRNVKIGFVLLFLLIALFILDDLVFSPMLLKVAGGDHEIPSWLILLSGFSNILIFITFLYFAFQYYRIKRDADMTFDLRVTLLKIIRILQIYKRLFYLALITLSAAIAISFITGLVTGFIESAGERDLLLEDIPITTFLVVAGVGLLVMGILVGGIFLIMRWGFRRLYGNYIYKLKRTLKELEEMGS